MILGMGTDIVDARRIGSAMDQFPTNFINRMFTEADRHAAAIGVECHAGHGLDYDTVSQIAAIPTIEELNIGHFLIGESVFCGLPEAIKKMRNLMETARRELQTEAV